MTNFNPKPISLALSIIAALVLSACTLQFNTTIQENGSGELRVEFGLRPDEQAEAQSTVGSLDDLCALAQSLVRLPPGATTYVEQRGDERWCGTLTQFADLNELASLLIDQPGVLVNQITSLEDRFIFDVTVDLSRKLEIREQKYKAPDVVWQVP